MATPRKGEKQGSALTGWRFGMGPGRHDGAEALWHHGQDARKGAGSARSARLDPGRGVASRKRKGGAAMAASCALGKGGGEEP
jgi:hypothetical protein